MPLSSQELSGINGCPTRSSNHAHQMKGVVIMAIRGSLILEDTSITFELIGGAVGHAYAKALYTVEDLVTNRSETLEVDAKAFMTALSLSISWEGIGTRDSDYALAETVMPLDGLLRWIP